MLKSLLTKLFPAKRAKSTSTTGFEADSASTHNKQQNLIAEPLCGVNLIEGDGGDAEWELWEQAMRRTRGEPVGAPHVLEVNPQFKIVQQSFERIADRLKLVWGHKEFRPYMDGLLHDTRGGTRKGFPAAVLFALHALSEEHDEKFPVYCAKGDRWSGHMDTLQRQYPFKS